MQEKPHQGEIGWGRPGRSTHDPLALVHFARSIKGGDAQDRVTTIPQFNFRTWENHIGLCRNAAETEPGWGTWQRFAGIGPERGASRTSQKMVSRSSSILVVVKLLQKLNRGDPGKHYKLPAHRFKSFALEIGA